MLSEIDDPAKIADIEKIAVTLSKALAGVDTETALMGLCAVVADVISEAVEPEHWHLCIADVVSAVALNVGHHAEDCEHCKAAERKH